MKIEKDRVVSFHYSVSEQARSRWKAPKAAIRW
jgi:hypothetical protein